MTTDDHKADPLKAFYENMLDRMRLHKLAESFGIDREGDLGSGWAYDLALAMARKKFPGFSRPEKAKKSRPRGPKSSKDLSYRIKLSMAAALQQQIDGKLRVKAKAARALALQVETARANGKRPSQEAVKNRALQIATDMSSLTDEERYFGVAFAIEWRGGVGTGQIVEALQKQVTSGEWQQNFETYKKLVSHKVPRGK